jgi:hypothetical protein
MKWVGHVVYIRKEEMFKNFTGKHYDRDLWGDLGMNGRVVLKGIIKKFVMEIRTGVMWLRIGFCVSFFEHNTEDSIIVGNFWTSQMTV